MLKMFVGGNVSEEIQRSADNTHSIVNIGGQIEREQIYLLSFFIRTTIL